MKQVCLRPLFAAMDDTEAEKQKVCKKDAATSLVRAIDRHMGAYTTVVDMNGIKRIQLCRQALDALDRRGWDRSFHQRLFHEVRLEAKFESKNVRCVFPLSEKENLTWKTSQRRSISRAALASFLSGTDPAPLQNITTGSLSLIRGTQRHRRSWLAHQGVLARPFQCPCSPRP